MTQTKLPEKISIKGIEGRLVYARSPSELFQKADPSKERIASLAEMASLRIESEKILLRRLAEISGSSRLSDQVSIGNHLIESDQITYGIWDQDVRPTTALHLLRATDESCEDAVFFYEGNPFKTMEEMIRTFKDGNISDGGVRYPIAAVEHIVSNTHPDRKMNFQDYKRAGSGNLTLGEWILNPIVGKAFGNERLLYDYAAALSTFDSLRQNKRHMHSVWKPNEMEAGYGRMISLGYKADAFYPPNNATTGHSMLLLKK